MDLECMLPQNANSREQSSDANSLLSELSGKGEQAAILKPS